MHKTSCRKVLATQNDQSLVCASITKHFYYLQKFVDMANLSGVMQRHSVSFLSGGIRCAGILYLPVNHKTKLPCVVLANGFSGTMDWILPAYAEGFCSNGFAVLIFDYRHLGQSEGKPRQLIDPRKQIEDLNNAIQFAKNHGAIDADNIALWGTSLGGSYVLSVAANDPTIRAVIGNMPAIDSIRGTNFSEKLKKSGVSKLKFIIVSMKLVLGGLIDALCGILGRAPFYLKVYGKPGLAFFTDASLKHRFEQLEKESSHWQNKIAPRFLFKAPRYKKGTFARIKVPILLVLAAEDTEISPEFVKEKAREASHVQIKEFPGQHFDMYHGATFTASMAVQVDFLKRIFSY